MTPKTKKASRQFHSAISPATANGATALPIRAKACVMP